MVVALAAASNNAILTRAQDSSRRKWVKVSSNCILSRDNLIIYIYIFNDVVAGSHIMEMIISNNFHKDVNLNTNYNIEDECNIMFKLFINYLGKKHIFK